MPPSNGLDPQILLQALAGEELFSCIGVPDSTLEPLIAALRPDSRFSNLAATNECEAVSIALGHYLGSGTPSVIYLQNSGFGKTIHPITSLLSKEICSIPALLLIGWRGCPEETPAAVRGKHKDEPQHAQMGRIMPQLLEAIEVPYEVLTSEPSQVFAAVHRAREHMRSQRTPYALVVKPGLFANKAKKEKTEPTASRSLSRKQVLEQALKLLPADTLYVSTTGKASRELYFLREDRGEDHRRNFYVVGGMGCASSIALGIAQKIRSSQPERTVCVVDGDGAALMQLGSFATIGHQRPENLLHLLIDNESYESTGGQPSISPGVEFTAVARACGYPWARSCDSAEGLQSALQDALSARGPRLLVIKTNATSDPKLGRPRETPAENANAFMTAIGSRSCPSS